MSVTLCFVSRVNAKIMCVPDERSVWIPILWCCGHSFWKSMFGFKNEQTVTRSCSKVIQILQNEAKLYQNQLNSPMLQKSLNFGKCRFSKAMHETSQRNERTCCLGMITPWITRGVSNKELIQRDGTFLAGPEMGTTALKYECHVTDIDQFNRGAIKASSCRSPIEPDIVLTLWRRRR